MSTDATAAFRNFWGGMHSRPKAIVGRLSTYKLYGSQVPLKYKTTAVVLAAGSVLSTATQHSPNPDESAAWQRFLFQGKIANEPAECSIWITEGPTEFGGYKVKIADRCKYPQGSPEYNKKKTRTFWGSFRGDNLDGLKFNEPPYQEPLDENRTLEPFDMNNKFHPEHQHIRNVKAVVLPSNALAVEMNVNLEKCKIQKGTRQLLDRSENAHIICGDTMYDLRDIRKIFEIHTVLGVSKRPVRILNDVTDQVEREPVSRVVEYVE